MTPLDQHWLAMSEALGRLDGKLDQVLTAQLDIKERVGDHETRIRVLEKSRWKLIGIGSAIGVVMSFLVPFLKNQGHLSP